MTAIASCRTTRGLSSVTDIVSSIDGIMLERKATIGQIVQAVEPVFTIADLSHVWLVADVPEQSAGQHQRWARQLRPKFRLCQATKSPARSLSSAQW